MNAKLLWYVNRLRAMSVPELAHRLRERRLRKAGRAIGAARFAQTGAVRAGAMPFDPDRFDALAREAVPEWRAEVARAQAGAWHFLGTDWPQTPLDRLWHLDPSSGLDWPAEPYCFDINYRHQSRLGDIKFVWEVNRLQILPVAAALARADGDTQARDFALSLIDSWIAANPPYRGVNWCSGIELAIRAVNILAAVALLGPETLSPDLGRRLVESLDAHRFWLARYPSRFSSANNHRIAELAALHILGRCMPDLTGARAEADASWRELMAEALLQIHPDGVGAEQSPTYTSFTLEWLALSVAVGRDAGDIVPAEVTARLTAAATVLHVMADTLGNLPRIGDDDEGRVLLSGAAREADYPALILSSLSALLARPDLAPRRDRAHLRQLWLGRADAGAVPAEGVRHFDAGGYSVVRSTIAGRESILCVDHGPLGFLAIAAHGHADALAVWWHLDDQPVLIDAGTYLYHAGGSIRDRFRGTAVHNTLCLDGVDQSTISGAFNWSRKAQARRIARADATIEAVHDGYSGQGVLHHRSITPVADGYEIRDWLSGTPARAEAVATLHWLIAPELTLHQEGSGVVLRRDAEAVMRIDAFRADATQNPQPEPVPLEIMAAEVSPDFGRRADTQALSMSLPARAFAAGGVVTRFTVLAGSRQSHE
ncbi:heparinase II/III domain-containing protein [Phaeovulum sp. W22_SRMD_FR3]|uniref:heparinase II/III domain-containing protein n=1 Tax=Phaeovulum sp. W22_SRMD_FR3 TaxID=3240274 RepID=UPI003F9BF4AF